MGDVFPYVGADGFAELDTLEVKAQRASADDFAALYPAPSLVFRLAATGGPKDSDAWLRRTEDDDEITVRSDNTPAQPRVYSGRAAFLRKRNVNPFAGMITVGRAINNDVVIALPSVSKFHGYFMQEAGAWIYVDHRSTNGSLVNDVKAEPTVKTKLPDGARMRIGKEVFVEFMTPKMLHAFLRTRR